jgi:hypothetical protein
MRPSFLFGSLLAVGFLALGARPAAACTCVTTLSPCQAFARSSIVFVGDVVSVEEVGDAFHMRLRVVRGLKGMEAPTAELWSSTSSCGVKLDKGGRYVIYTDLVSGRMSISACGYGVRLAPGEPGPEPPVPGRIYGRVTRYDIDGIRDSQSLEPIPSVRIALDRPAGRVIATSNAGGRFQFTGVPAGTYKLTVEAGQGLTPWRQDSVVLQDGEVCAETEVVLWPAGKMSGSVRTADGTPASGIYLRLVPDARVVSPLVQHVHLGRTTGPDGRFTFDGLLPDNYVLAVNPDGTEATGRQPQAPAWFGGRDRRSARRIPIEEGSAIELDRPFVLPPPLPTSTFTVVVTCRDGSVPLAVMTRALAKNGAAFAEFDDMGDGQVRTLPLVRDQAYTLMVSILIPAAPERPSQGGPIEKKLRPTDLLAGAPGRRVALGAPFVNCGETAR